MLLMPLHKPWSRQNIPWVTLLLVLVNVVVYLGYQRKDDALVENAVRYYVESGLGALEAQAHERYLQQTDDTKLRAARQGKLGSVPARQRLAYLAQLTMHDLAFTEALRSGALFRTSSVSANGAPCARPTMRACPRCSRYGICSVAPSGHLREC